MEQTERLPFGLDVEAWEHGVVVVIDGRLIELTREQEALIRSWASGPV